MQVDPAVQIKLAGKFIVQVELAQSNSPGLRYTVDFCMQVEIAQVNPYAS